jgi:Zn-finger nucleic acid-binding protein
MITVKDINGVMHDKCPRCGGNWEDLGPGTKVCMANRFECDMMACQHRGDFYFLTITLKDARGAEYNIYWDEIDCMVDVTDKIVDINARLPTLPYGISIDKLKKYLVFS